MAVEVAVIVTIVSVAISSYFWKRSIFSIFFVLALAVGAWGLVLTKSGVLDKRNWGKAGLMFFPLIYLICFQLLRFVFRKWKGTEPYITGVSSRLGHPPDELEAEKALNKTSGRFEPDRVIMLSDFAFSFLQVLVPIAVTILVGFI